MLRWKSLFSNRLPKGERRRGRNLAANSRRLAVESLEDRRMLANVTVSNILDVVNGDVTSIATLNADDGGDGISLREAVEAANNDAGDPSDTVLFDVTLNGLEIDLSGTEIEITDDLTIDALGLPAGITIDAQNMSRIFNITAATGDFTLKGLTLTRGKTTADNEEGGAVRSSTNDDLTIDGCMITASSTTGTGSEGGAVFANDNLILTNSTVSGNSTTGSDSDGGGVYSFFGSVTLTNSIVSGNSTAGTGAEGGGIYAFADVTLTNSTVSGNSTTGDDSDGGGIYAVNSVTLTNSTVSGNRTEGSESDGGGIYSRRNVTLTKSTVSGNFTQGGNARGGGIFAFGLEGEVTLTDSTVSGNHTEGGGAHGGGIFAGSYFYDEGGFTYATVTLTNSTVSGNFTEGSESDGGGIYALDDVTVNMSTITLNRAEADDSNGGGIWNDDDDNDEIVIRNSIVAANTAGGVGPDLRPGSGSLDVDYSLIGDNAGTALVEAQTPDADGNLIGSAAGAGIIDPGLNPLGNNGGPTQTHSLKADSKALNAGDPGVAAVNNEFDQRGTPFFRVRLGRLDMGAFEAQIIPDDTAEIGTWAAGTVLIDLNGDFIFNPVNPDPTQRDVAFRIGFGTDYIFAGNFAGPGTDLTFGSPDDTTAPAGNAIADGFDKVAAYGRGADGQYRWLFDINNNGVADFSVIDPAGINGFPVAGNFDGNLANGDEVGIFTGTSWHFDTNHDFKVDTPFATGNAGFPIAGDFDGDGDDDVATYVASNGGDIFFVDRNTAAAGAKILVDGAADFSFRMGSPFGGDISFAGPRERPVAADFNGDGVDDIGLWVPDGINPVPNELAEWFILISGDDPLTVPVEVTVLDRILGGPLNGFIPFSPAPFGNDLYIQFGNTFALPIAGNFLNFSPPEPPPPPPVIIPIVPALNASQTTTQQQAAIAAIVVEKSTADREVRRSAKREVEAQENVASATQVIAVTASTATPPVESVGDPAPQLVAKRSEKRSKESEKTPVIEQVVQAPVVAPSVAEPAAAIAAVIPPVVEPVAEPQILVAARVDSTAVERPATDAKQAEKSKSSERSRSRSLVFANSEVAAKAVTQIVIPAIVKPAATVPVVTPQVAVSKTIDTVQADRDLKAQKLAAVDKALTEIAPVPTVKQVPEVVQEAAVAQAAAWQDLATKTNNESNGRRSRGLIYK